MSLPYSCKRKVRYGHQETALEAIRNMKTKGFDSLSEYQCSWCSGWHIGHDHLGMVATVTVSENGKIISVKHVPITEAEK